MSEPDLDKVEYKLASLMALVAEVQDTDVQIAMESRLQQAHAEVGERKEQLYRYVDD